MPVGDGVEEPGAMAIEVFMKVHAYRGTF